jgi:hypothetical protein
VQSLPFDSTQAQEVETILSSLIGSFDPQNQIEQNIKDYYEIYLNSYALGEEVGSEQRDRLWEIANACPVDNGHAVYSARAFISMINPGVLTAYFNCDGGQNLARSINPDIKNKNEVSLYPNPSNDKMFIDGLLSNEEYSMLIYDLTGRIVLESVIESNEINLYKLQPGIYLYRIENLNSVINSGRISIIK